MTPQDAPDLDRLIADYLTSSSPVPYAAGHEIGDGDFRAIGAEFLAHCVRLGGLQRHHNVLDIGCGFGRIALPLAHYLAPEARLLGFDIVEEPIAWCREHISAQRPGFTFEHLDFRHPLYNPDGGVSTPKGFSAWLPGLDALQPDFILATSVFTHLEQASICDYLEDCSALLKPGGILFLTLFLTGEGTAPAGPHAVFPRQQWRQQGPLFALAGAPLTAAVGLDLPWLQAQLSALSLQPTQLHSGHWRWGRHYGGPFQDLLVCRKADES